MWDGGLFGSRDTFLTACTAVDWAACVCGAGGGTGAQPSSQGLEHEREIEQMLPSVWLLIAARIGPNAAC